MRISLLILSILTSCSNIFSQSFFIHHNKELIEKRNYEKGKLQSIISYEQNSSKDSVTYNGNDVQYFSFQGDSIVNISLCPYAKFYYCEFDESFHDNYIYHIINSHQLLERILYFLATIDSEITNDKELAHKRQYIAINKNSICIQYKRINRKFQLFAEFETYRYETLKNMFIYINNGLLTNISLKGTQTDINISFEYQNQNLKKEKIYYYRKRSHKLSSYEDYSYDIAITLSSIEQLRGRLPMDAPS